MFPHIRFSLQKFGN